jgi:hypothetical protein
VPEVDAAAEESAAPTIEAREPAPPQDAAPPEGTAGDPGGGVDALAPIADVPEPEATTSPEQHGEE